MEPIASCLGLPLVPFSEWLSSLERRLAIRASKEQFNLVPALRLFDFFKTGRPADKEFTESNGLQPRVSVVEAMKVSQTLRDEALPQLNAEEAHKWLSYWKDIGFLPV